MDKKTIVIIVLAILLVGCLVYFFAFYEQNEPEKDTITENTEESSVNIGRTSDNGLFDSKPAQKKEYNLEKNTDKTGKQSISENTSNVEDEIVGLWHISPHVAAGYAERYYFYPDKTFRFAANSMDGENRNVGYMGSWTVKDGILTITITKEEILEGGHLEQSPSSITGKEITDGEIIEKDVNPAKIVKYNLDLKPDSEGFITITSGKIKYYKISPHPDI